MITYTFDDSENNVSAKYWSRAFPIEHTHTFYEIIFVCHGTLSTVLDGSERIMNKYDICLVKPENIHIQLPEHSDNPQFYNIMIKASYFESFCDNIYDGVLSTIKSTKELYSSISSSIYTIVLELLNSASLLFNKKQSNQCLNLAAAILIPLLIPRESITIINKTPLTKAMEIMNDPKTINLSVKDVAKQLGYTPEHFSRIFKQEYNTTPQKLFFDIKMQQAKLLLCQTDMSIKTIAYSIGLDSVRYFYTAFKKHFNTTPAKMRTSYRTE